MERNDTQIKSIIEKIIFLLQSNDETGWAMTFEKFLDKFSSSENQKDVVKEIIDIYKGGRGSFSDLVLQKDMKLPIDENEQLAKLKHVFFNSCQNFLDGKIDN